MAKDKNKVAVPPIFINNLEAAAAASKLIKEDSKNESSQRIQPSELTKLSAHTYSLINTNNDILELFPDIELSMKLLVSSILAPNDMTTTSIIYENNDLPLPSDMRHAMLESIRNHMENEYDIDDKFNTILEEAIFTKGAYIEAIIPENVVDAMINRDTAELSTESIVDRIEDMASGESGRFKLLGDDGGKDVIKASVVDGTVNESENEVDIHINMSVEEATDLLGIEFSDTIGIITSLEAKKQSVAKYSKEKASSSTISISSESISDSLDGIFKSLQESVFEPTQEVPSESVVGRKSVGKPLTIKLPVESVVPIHVPGDPTDHVGYILLLDENGVPINHETQTAQSSDVDGNSGIMANRQSFKDKIISKSTAAVKGKMVKAPVVSNMEMYYNAILEKVVAEKLKSSAIGDISSIELDNNAIYRTMFFRKLRNKKTRILFVHEENMAYYAFKYRINGTGKSLLETISILVSIRAMLFYTKLAATVRNSITNTDINITLEDDDQDPVKSMNQAMSIALKTVQAEVPVGISKIDDLSEWVQRIGVRFNFKHPKLPNMEIDRSDSSTSKEIPDSDLDMEVRKQILMSFGIPPKAVEDGYDSDFATTIVQNDRMFTKRVKQYTKQFTIKATDHVRKLLRADATMISKLTKIVSGRTSDIRTAISVNDDLKNRLEGITDEDLVAYVVKRFISTTSIDLPSIESHETDNMKDAFSAYKDSIEEYFDIILSEDAIPDELLGELNVDKDTLKVALMNTFLRKWMADNNYMTELLQMHTLDSDGTPLFDAYGDYTTFLESFSKTILPFLKGNKKFKEKFGEEINKLTESSDSQY